MELILETCVILFVVFYITPAQVNGVVRCRRCSDIASPATCTATQTCGQGEICYTREYMDNRGGRRYRMGCEDSQACYIRENAQNVLGKRDTSNAYPAPPNKCYACCVSNECNAGLCYGSSGGQSHVLTTPTPRLTASPRCSKTGCPDFALAFRDYCYFFGLGKTNWAGARLACQNKGGDLLSLASAEEHGFLKQQLLALNATYTEVYWIGAINSKSSSRRMWRWTDGTPFTYAPWTSPPTSSSYTQDEDYYGILYNPATNRWSSSYNKALIHYVPAHSVRNAILCKRRRAFFV